MPQVTESTVVDGPVGEVWALLRDFAAIGDWHPALPPAEIEDGPADRVGSVRVYPLAGGHRETLTGLDDQRRRIAFTFADHARQGCRSAPTRPLLTARPVTLSNQTYVEWSSRFDCDEADEDKAIAAVRDWRARSRPEGAGAAVRPRLVRAVTKCTRYFGFTAPNGPWFQFPALVARHMTIGRWRPPYVPSKCTVAPRSSLAPNTSAWRTLINFLVRPQTSFNHACQFGGSVW